MKVVDHGKDNSPTFMRDVYAALIGKEVTIYTKGSFPMGGILEAYNGYIIKLTSEYGPDIYMSVDNILAISGKE
jgi:hypothetical protein